MHSKKTATKKERFSVCLNRETKRTDCSRAGGAKKACKALPRRPNAGDRQEKAARRIDAARGKKRFMRGGVQDGNTAEKEETNFLPLR